MANRVNVTIRSHNYPILAEEDESYIRQCADLVSRELDRALDGTTLSLDDGAILAALNLADQYYKERQVSDNLRAQLKEALDENARIRRQSSQRKAPRSGGKKAPKEPEAAPVIPVEPSVEPAAETVAPKEPEAAPVIPAEPFVEPAAETAVPKEPEAVPASPAEPSAQPRKKKPVLQKAEAVPVTPAKPYAEPSAENPLPGQTRLIIPGASDRET